MEIFLWITAPRDFSSCVRKQYWESAEFLRTATWLSDTNTNQFLSLNLQFPSKYIASIIWHAEEKSR